jgi:serine/threonine-protein kinase
LSGRRAFNGRNSTEVTYQLLTVEPPDLTELVAEVPKSLADVLRFAMAKQRDARYASARAMADALRSAMHSGGEPNAASPIDVTVVTPPPSAFEPAARVPIDDATLDTIERRLARHIGPLARHLVREAARRTTSIEELCETVSRNIGQTAERKRFLTESLDGSLSRSGTTIVRTTVRRTATTNAGKASGGDISAEQIERVERALTRFVGPIARVLVKRALPAATSEAALWEQLAARIERPADRDAFLRQRPGG